MSRPSRDAPIQFTIDDLIVRLREEWQCCNQQNLSPDNILLHLNVHHQPEITADDKLKCPKCAETFPERSSFVAHFLVSHIQYQFRCLQCMGAYMYLGAYLEHIDPCSFFRDLERNRGRDNNNQ